jgi:hypothetical protein
MLKKQLNISDKKYRIICNGVAVEKFEELTCKEMPFDFNQKYLYLV